MLTIRLKMISSCCDKASSFAALAQTSECTAINQTLLATGFPYYDFEKMDQYIDLLKELMKSCHGLRRMGSAAIDLVYVACGRFDAFFEYNLKFGKDQKLSLGYNGNHNFTTSKYRFIQTSKSRTDYNPNFVINPFELDSQINKDLLDYKISFEESSNANWKSKFCSIVRIVRVCEQRTASARRSFV